MDEEWVDIPRGTTRPPHEFAPMVTIRSDSFYFNKHCVSRHELGKYNYVRIRLKPRMHQIFFIFDDNAPDERYWRKLRKVKSEDRVATMSVKAQTVINHEDCKWIRKIAELEDSRLRRFVPKSEAANVLIIQLAPAFEKRVENPSDIPAQAKGLYRYLRADEVVYIGRGNVRQRASEAFREHWQWDLIEYSVVEDPAEQKSWEDYFLALHLSQYGKRPLYNRTGGSKPRKDK
jgi:hypothetical protein